MKRIAIGMGALSMALLLSALVLSGTDLTLTAFSLSTNAVNVDDASAAVTCNMTITTSGSAIEDAGCTIRPLTGKPLSCSAHSGAGDVWSCDVTIPRYAESGTWAIDHLTIRDATFGSASPTNAELVADGPLGLIATDLDVEVTSSSNDTSGPSITSFTVLPATVDPGDSVTCSIGATDPSGILDIGCTFIASSEPDPISCTGHGVATSCIMTVPAGADAGVTWNEVNHLARDTVVNRTLIEGSESFATTGAGGGSCDSFVYDYRGISGWSATQTVAAATTTVTFDYWAKVDAASQDALVAFGQSTPLQDYDEAAMLIRFNGSGTIDVRDVAVYGCPGTTCPAYSPDIWYHFEVTANIETDLYTVDVTPCDGSKVSVAINAGFRTGTPPQPVTSISYHSANSTQAEYIEVDQMTWTPGSCTPDSDATTCTGGACGTVINNCGTPIDCDVENGTCDSRSSGDVCLDNACCNPETAATTCTGGACGDVNNNCGESVDCDVENGTCDSRVPGEICTGNVCGEAGVYARPNLANTGPNDIAALTAYTGPNPVVINGTLIEDKIISSKLDINANNVTVRNVRINQNGSNYALEIRGNYSGILLEDFEIVQGTGIGVGKCAYLQGADDITIRRGHFDQCPGDPFFIELGALGVGITFESSLFTRAGTFSGSACGSHGDIIQTEGITGGTSFQGTIFMLGNRVVPAYCGCGSGGWYKISNVMQPDGSGGNAKYHHINNWYDGSTNYLIGPGGTHYFADNFFGNAYNNDVGLWSSGTWPPGMSSWTEANNVWECEPGTVITSSQQAQPSCTLGIACGGNGSIGNCPTCVGVRDDYPIDPTTADDCETLYCDIHGTGTYTANSCSASPVVCP